MRKLIDNIIGIFKKMFPNRRTQIKKPNPFNGFEVFYYKNKYDWKCQPKKGIIQEVNGKFVVNWEKKNKRQ